MKQLQSDIEQNLSGTTGQLEKLHLDIGSTLDKISTRENYLNKQLEPYLNDYKSLQVRLQMFYLKYELLNKILIKI